ncbi:MAG: DUF1203 domain-containing protein [Alphaproteobacteria bacterium]|nr:DUF1203 domain-containing protein [Alphaproteobacteria bacterium]
MTDFRCLPIATEIADRFRATGRDDAGNELRRREPGADSRCPCRHCLGYGQSGQTMLLGSYNLPRPRGVYWTPSPIFLHAGPCSRYDRVNDIPEIVRGALVSVRAYDTEDQCLYELGQVSDGSEIDAPLRRALDDPRTASVNIHTAKPGCLLCRVERC